MEFDFSNFQVWKSMEKIKLNGKIIVFPDYFPYSVFWNIKLRISKKWIDHTSRVISWQKFSDHLMINNQTRQNEFKAHIFITQNLFSLFWTSLNKRLLKSATDKGANGHLNQTVLCCNIKPQLQYQNDVSEVNPCRL